MATMVCWAVAIHVSAAVAALVRPKVERDLDIPEVYGLVVEHAVPHQRWGRRNVTRQIITLISSRVLVFTPCTVFQGSQLDNTVFEELLEVLVVEPLELGMMEELSKFRLYTSNKMITHEEEIDKM